MYVSLRKYEINPGTEDELIQRAKEGFLPIIKTVSGFVDYYIVSVGNDRVNTVSIFEEEKQVRESDQLAAEWVAKNMALFVVGTPEVVQGKIVVRS